jgi:large subunit ribosomal protein L17
MRHAKRRQRLNRFSSWRKNTLISLTKNLLIKQRIITTKAKAKAARRLTEQIISLSKKNTLFAMRRVFQILQDHNLVSRLFKEIGPRFEKRNSGFTRIIPLGKRRGDNARMVILELTEQKEKKKKEKKPKKEEIKEETKPMPKAPEAKPPKEEKPKKKFLGGLRKVFKKERDAL